MLHFYRFSTETPPPAPARAVYAAKKAGQDPGVRSPKGRGSPEECPPVRAANSFGWDVHAAHDMTFLQKDGDWSIENPVDLESDWAFSSEADAEGAPLVQRNAWFWDKDQVLPHVIAPEVYPEIAHQVKISTFLFLRTDPNELLFITDIPNANRPYRTLTALVDTDWYPASYPWHCVIELDRTKKRIQIAKGEPVCRLFTVRRDHYFAREMTPREFEDYFQRTQDWLRRHGKGEKSGDVDITGAYIKQQQLSKFSVTL
jgi:hypothetical protein